MGETGNLLQVFGGMIVALGAGAVVVAVSVTDDRRTLVSVAIGIGLLGVLIWAAGQPQAIGWPDLGKWAPAAVGGALGFAFIVRNVFLIPVSTNYIGILGEIGNSAKSALAPRRWAEAVGKPPVSYRDLTKRWFVSVAAGTGGVVFSLATLGIFWRTLWAHLTPVHVLTAIAMTVVSFTLIGPLHEYIKERGLEEDHVDRSTEPLKGQGLFENLSIRSYLRLGLMGLLLLALDVVSATLGESMQAGQTEAIFLILLGGITPAVVSYYWCAALQLDAASVMQSATQSATYAGAAIFSMMALALAIGGANWMGLYDFKGAAPAVTVLGSFFITLVGTCAIALLFSLLTCGLYALLGGYAIDRFRGKVALWAILGALILATVPQQLVADAIILFVTTPNGTVFQTPAPTLTEVAASMTTSGAYQPSGFDWVNLFAGTIGWFVGLLASGFPELVKRKSTKPVQVNRGLGV